MSKREVLRDLKVGARVAEEESTELANYFVETDQWQRIFAGEVDVIYGPKGSGKSAIYSLLISRTDSLFDRRILVVAGENPRGTPAFRDLVADPPSSEDEFRNLWKLYLVALIGEALREYGISNSPATELFRILSEAKLLEKRASLDGLVRDVLKYVRNIGKAEAVEGGLQFDPNSGLVNGVTGRIVFRAPASDEAKAGLVSVDSLMELANRAAEEADYTVWVLLDRLDVAFADTEDLEKNALRALFRVYLDARQLRRLQFKIFLRTDIWRRITEQGWREASHITGAVTIKWSRELLLNLVVRRLLQTKILRNEFAVDEDATLKSTEKQSEFFYALFPRQVDTGPNKPTTFDWMLSRTRDGSGDTAPRELIHLLTEARGAQLRQLEIGQEEPQGTTIIGPGALREALIPVSEVRLFQTIFAEYPAMRSWMEKLEGQKTQQTPATLSEIWRVDQGQAEEISAKLVEIGFFERRGTRDAPVYWVPFLYRPALKLVQGAADTDEMS
jgi:hypothetical protein